MKKSINYKWESGQEDLSMNQNTYVFTEGANKKEAGTVVHNLVKRYTESHIYLNI